MVAAVLVIGTNAIAQNAPKGASQGQPPPADATQQKKPSSASPSTKPAASDPAKPAVPSSKNPITPAQGRKDADTSENKASPATARVVPPTLDVTPTAIESLGMTLHLPKGGTFARDMQSATPAFVLDDQQDPPRYRCRLSILVPSELDATCESLVTDHLHAMQDRGQKPTILVNELLPCGDRDGRLFYASVPLDESTTAITGWYLVQMAPSQFLVCSVVSSSLDFPPVRATLKDFFTNWDFADRDAIAVRQVERLKAGSELLERINPAVLRAA
ncbi:MAG: hypothetical protein FJ252_09665, partial [Phycisphaerae bacterium]|nr:hypothetical protein [Phycisphaerae bacterium]